MYFTPGSKRRRGKDHSPERNQTRKRSHRNAKQPLSENTDEIEKCISGVDGGEKETAKSEQHLLNVFERHFGFYFRVKHNLLTRAVFSTLRKHSADAFKINCSPSCQKGFGPIVQSIVVKTLTR